MARLFRLIEYVGDEQWIADTLANSIEGNMPLGTGGSGIFTRIVEEGDVVQSIAERNESRGYSAHFADVDKKKEA